MSTLPSYDEVVTVVVPTHNRVSILKDAIASVRDQREVQVRLVIVDDASSDGTESWLASGALDGALVLRHDVPLGPAVARNVGVAATTTRWVAFLDDDDLWAPDKLASQLDALAQTPDARWSTTGTVSVDTSLTIMGHQRPTTSGWIHNDLLSHNVVPAGNSTVVVDRALFWEVGGFDETLSMCEDYDLWLRLAQASPIATVDAPLTAYRVSRGARSTHIELLRDTHEAVAARYRAGAPPTPTQEGDLTFAQFAARFHLRNHDRVAACLAYLAIARRYRLPTHVVHAALALVAPRFSERHRARAERAEVPARWATSAESWLALRRPNRRPSTAMPA